jgi:hypothetical protein
MASETMVLEESTQAPSLETLLPETIPSATGNSQPQSPVDVIIEMRKDLAEFRRTGNSQALRKKAREELRAACIDALQRGAAAGADRPDYPNIEPIVEYLQERRLVRPKLSRAQIRRLEESSLPPNEKTSEGGGR